MHQNPPGNVTRTPHLQTLLEPSQTKLGNFLKSKRSAKGLSGRAVCDHSGIAVTKYYALESGVGAVCTLEDFIALAKAFGHKPSAFMKLYVEYKNPVA